MAFDPQLVEAKLALGMIGPDQMPALACDALEAGFDGPAIIRMAVLINPSGWETDRLLSAFMADAGLPRISIEQASVRIARDLARRILTEDLDPLAYTRDFESLWIRADHASAIQEAGSLDDQKAAADYIGQSEADLRAYARAVLVALAATGEPEAHG